MTFIINVCVCVTILRFCSWADWSLAFDVSAPIAGPRQAIIATS